MENILSEKELLTELNNFKFVLHNFDYKDIENLIFLNLESLYVYIENVENNPFKLQYEKLQKILDVIEPYIPFVTENGFINMIEIENLSDSEELKNIQKIFSSKKRVNFTNIIRIINNNTEWENIVNICKEIRNDLETSDISHTKDVSCETFA